MAKKPTLSHVETLIARNETRLKRTMTALDKLKKQRARLLKAAPTVPASTLVAAVKGHIARTVTVRASLPAHPTVDSETTLGTGPSSKPTTDDDKLDIPGFLRRQGPSDADKAAADKLKAEQAATKKAKAQGRIATMKAKKSGETRKMPLTGKAALALINNG